MFTLIIGGIILFVLSIFPIIMVLRERANIVITVLAIILNLIGFATFGLATFAAFIVACLGIKFTQTLKYVAVFVIMLIIILAMGITETAMYMKLFGAL